MTHLDGVGALQLHAVFMHIVYSTSLSAYGQIRNPALYPVFEYWWRYKEMPDFVKHLAAL